MATTASTSISGRKTKALSSRCCFRVCQKHYRPTSHWACTRKYWTRYDKKKQFGNAGLCLISVRLQSLLNNQRLWFLCRSFLAYLFVSRMFIKVCFYCCCFTSDGGYRYPLLHLRCSTCAASASVSLFSSGLSCYVLSVHLWTLYSFVFRSYVCS